MATQTFKFAVRNSQGVRIQGVMKANSQKEAIQELQNQGLTVTSIQSSKQMIRTQRLQDKELATLCQQLATTIRVGMPILKSLHSIREHVKRKSTNQVLSRIATDVSTGTSLTLAFSNQASYFPDLFIQMIRAAEINGNLEHAFQTLAQSFRQSYEVKKKIRSAILYPVIVLLFAVIMVSLLVFFVLPTFTRMFESMHSSLPWFTRLLLNSRGIVTDHGLIFLLAIILLLISLMMWANSTRGRKQVDRLLNQLPIVRSLTKQKAIYRFCNTLRDLYASGIAIESALKLVSGVMTNRMIQDAVKKVAIQVGNGSTMSNALQASGIFPSLFLSMVHIGEETGEMEEMLAEMATQSKYELEQMINQLISLIEPFLVIGVGLLVGGVIISIIIPLYDGMLSIGS